MYILFETSGGNALFHIAKDKKLKDPANIWEEFQDASEAAKKIKLTAFQPFDNTTEALTAASNVVDSSLSKDLKKFLKENLKDASSDAKICVQDPKLGGEIKKKFDKFSLVPAEISQEIFRGVRSHIETLVPQISSSTMKQMQLGLSHSLGRYKLKFSADKVDTMIVQAIGLLDELDKEINIYAMRVREWYGWHFPEMVKIVNDNTQYAKCVLRMGFRTNCKNCDFSDILGDENVETNLKETAEISMGTEISDNDMETIKELSEEVIHLSEYRIELYEYLKNRMNAIAPNLAIMVGELVGARLIAHAGSLLNLAKHPASTIQILGAEKALFRALKTKHDTPKYGMIYNASLIGQANSKHKGKISRILAAKTALSIRVDAMGEVTNTKIGQDNRAKVELRLRQLEGGMSNKISMGGNTPSKGNAKYDSAHAIANSGTNSPYNDGMDIVETTKKNGGKKRKLIEEFEESVEEFEKKDNKKKKIKKRRKKCKKIQKINQKKGRRTKK